MNVYIVVSPCVLDVLCAFSICPRLLCNDMCFSVDGATNQHYRRARTHLISTFYLFLHPDVSSDFICFSGGFVPFILKCTVSNFIAIRNQV